MEAKRKQTKEVEEIQCQAKCKYFVFCFIVRVRGELRRPKEEGIQSENCCENKIVRKK